MTTFGTDGTYSTVNKDNEWVMYDKDGKVTENVEEAGYDGAGDRADAGRCRS